MLKKFVSCAAIMMTVTAILPTSASAAENVFVANSVNYTDEAKSKVIYYQTNDVDTNAEKSEVKVSSKEVPYTTITKQTDSLT